MSAPLLFSSSNLGDNEINKYGEVLQKEVLIKKKSAPLSAAPLIWAKTKISKLDNLIVFFLLKIFGFFDLTILVFFGGSAHGAYSEQFVVTAPVVQWVINLRYESQTRTHWKRREKIFCSVYCQRGEKG